MQLWNILKFLFRSHSDFVSNEARGNGGDHKRTGFLNIPCPNFADSNRRGAKISGVNFINILRPAFLYLQFVFVVFCWKNIGAKAASKMTGNWLQNENSLDLTKGMKYDAVQYNGQRIYGWGARIKLENL